MSLTVAEMLQEWAAATGDHVSDLPSYPPTYVENLRLTLIQEEKNEVEDAILDAATEEDIADIAKELADLVYVVYGTALAYGIPLDKVIEEVHRSNMTKVVDGSVIRREDGKILKPETYEPADIESVLRDAA